VTIVSDNGTIRNLSNEALVRNFFEAIRHPATDDYYQTIWTRDLATGKKHTIWTPSGDIDALVSGASTQAQMGRDVYFGVGLQSEDLGHHQRGGSDDVTAIRMLSADIDVGSDGHKDSNRPATEAEALDIISGLPSPSIIVRSGNGLHVHWILREPLIIKNARQHKAAREFVEAWIDTIVLAASEYGGYKVDSTKDLARVLRVPGTLNFKGEEPKPVTILSQTDLRYTWTDLKPYVRKPSTTTATTSSALDSEKLEVAAKAIAPYVLNGSAHKLSLDLFGFLRGQRGDRLSSADTRRLVSRAWELGGLPATNGHNLLMQGLETTNKRIEAGEPVTGGVKLKEICPELSRELGSILWPESRIHPTRGNEPPGIDELADRMKAEANGKLCYSMGEWKRYADGVWSTADDVMIEKIAVEITRAAKAEGLKYTYNVANQVYSTVKRELAVPSDLWDKQENLLACKNVTLDLETFEPIPHNPEHYLTAGANYDYDPDTEGPNWDVVCCYIADNMGEDVLRFLQEYFGYCLTAKTEAEVMLFFVGARGAGKSTVIEGAEKMLGPDLFLASTLAGLQARFGRSGIVGKRLIVSKEMSQLKLLETDLIDSIISGESIQLEKKGRDPVTYTPVAKVMQAANKLPQVPNTEAGIYRRLKVINFPDPQTQRKDSVKAGVRKEGPYILNWALEGLKRLMDRGYFEVPTSVEIASQEWHNENNLVKLFIDTCLTDGSLTISQTELHRLYSKWCSDHNLKPLGLPQFTKATWGKEEYYVEHQGWKNGYKVLRTVGFTAAGRRTNTVGRAGFREEFVSVLKNEDDEDLMEF
jgi:putative DNA primase/helicase